MTRSIFQRYPAWHWALAATSAAAVLLIGSTAFASTGGSSGSSSDTWTTTVQVVTGVRYGAPVAPTGATSLTASTITDTSDIKTTVGEIGLTVSLPSTVSVSYTVEASQTLVSQNESALSSVSVVLDPKYDSRALAYAGQSYDYPDNQGETGSINTDPITLTDAMQSVTPQLYSPYVATTYTLSLTADQDLPAGTYSGAINFQPVINSAT